MMLFKMFGEHNTTKNYARRISIILLVVIMLMTSMPLAIAAGTTSYGNMESSEQTDSSVSMETINNSVSTVIMTTINEFKTPLGDCHFSDLDDVSGEIDMDSNDEEMIIDTVLVETESANIVVEEVIEYNKLFTKYVDIGKGMSGVTAEMLDECTAYNSQFQSFKSPFLNNGWIFIEAQEKSGIDALWIYALAVWESGWGNSQLARTKHNYFGIGAWDIDMSRAEHMGNSLYAGIVNGAIWIAEHYYDAGQTNMYLMNYTPGHSYAPGNEVWVPKIVEFVNKFYNNWRGEI